MHLTLTKEATKPAAGNVLQQQARLNGFTQRYNRSAPSGARDESPRRLLRASSPRLRGLEELTYPFHDHTILVTRCGRICFKGQNVNLSHVFAGQKVGVPSGRAHLARHLYALRFALF